MTKKIKLHSDASKRIQFQKISVSLADVFLDGDHFCTVKLLDADRIQRGELPDGLRYISDWGMMIRFMEAVGEFESE